MWELMKLVVTIKEFEVSCTSHVSCIIEGAAAQMRHFGKSHTDLIAHISSDLPFRTHSSIRSCDELLTVNEASGILISSICQPHLDQVCSSYAQSRNVIDRSSGLVIVPLRLLTYKVPNAYLGLAKTRLITSAKEPLALTPSCQSALH
jgi:hypothetical protein